MRLLLLITLICAPHIWACCPTDRDDFADEVEDESVLDIITGKIERPTPEYWHARLEQTQNSDLPPVEKDIELAKIEDQLNLQHIALGRIGNHLGDPTLDEPTRLQLYRLRAEVAMNLWWMGGQNQYTPEVCLMIALDGASMQRDAKYLKMITGWARDAKLEDGSLFLPDFFGLHSDANKSSDHDTGELEKRGLEDAEKRLLQRMKNHSAWENFDVVYSLSMLYMVQGKQNLAYFARLRAWEMHDAGMHSRVDGADKVGDIKPLTILRQLTAGELKPVKLVDEENQRLINEQFTARRAYVKEWKQARAAYAAEQLRKGLAPDSAEFWKGFSAPTPAIPPLRASESSGANATPPPEAEQSKEGAGSRTWITLGVLFALLVLGGLTKMRINRSATQVLSDPETPEARN